MKRFIAALVFLLIVGGVLALLITAVGLEATMAILLWYVACLVVVFALSWSILVLTGKL